MTLTLPGKSLDAQFDALWRRFQRLEYTKDSLNSWPMRWRRWLTPVNVSFIVPIEDEKVCQYLLSAQTELAPHMAYAPQPADKLHITLYQIGYLRTGPPLPGTWTRNALVKIIAQARQNLALLDPFEVRVGPINAFANVAFAEIHDVGRLRVLRVMVSQAVPRLRRPLPTYPLIPHVTLGYFGQRPAAPIREVLAPLHQLPPIVLRVERVHVTYYHRQPGRFDPAETLNHSVEEIIASLTVGR